MTDEFIAKIDAVMKERVRNHDGVNTEDCYISWAFLSRRLFMLCHKRGQFLMIWPGIAFTDRPITGSVLVQTGKTFVFLIFKSPCKTH
jgi:hypothetical protein